MINKKILVAAVLVLTISFGTGCVSQNKRDMEDNPSVESNVSEPRDNDIVKEYENMINNETNISQFISFVDKNIEKLSPENASKLIAKLEELQEIYIGQLEDKYNTTENQTILFEAFKFGLDLEKLKYKNIEDEEIKELLKETEELGYKVEMAEGSFFPVIDYGFYEKYSAYVTEDVKDYISIMAVESGKAPAKDAALAISWGELLERISKQERFLNEHKESVKFEKINELYGKYIFLALHGLDNTPLFGRSDNRLDDEAKAAYEKAITKDSQVSKVIKEYYELIKKNGYKMTEEVKNYRNQANENLK
ncbi:hypothetical protein [Lutispora thermophila]|uniref:SurA N-terminal domain-containing protein n=1 Tax=Lutispora thermophila DSM 19022 TaxID=1122184 RepID=A0A1M6FHK9_9FIRM|nr:hypothetical protein [Lutispora thermophila]SHI97082.1 hypothetical protein SAMN02745176_01963 [Lutispora thermophila DSM 19022]